MRISAAQFDIPTIQATWQAFETMTGIRPIYDETDYDHMVIFMNVLLDTIGDSETHPLSGLLDLVSDLVSNYEQKQFAIELVEPKEALRFLMEARGLKQEDLSAIVPQSNLSTILAGKRKISASLAGKLGKFFGISPAVFVPVST
ncbi:helix-turn-helix domain-containing protein [Sulfurirhabdus autotrophica]|uniref:HTH-type transcriptional regulator/antitoxin HigA n=1 Tax=Sulfurirhabdus autotrophica TaxID=1706046 RepID=A0A4R3XQL2_9PROT|nr:helix-turn-helix domain-containing protein [Sulfurirhabdus autotrophica]TCV81071.1 HTH-type transcriptional regulator/antitoxin HigA [Sulfurirhabdus autotrophica]